MSTALLRTVFSTSLVTKCRHRGRTQNVGGNMGVGGVWVGRVSVGGWKEGVETGVAGTKRGREGVGVNA